MKKFIFFAVLFCTIHTAPAQTLILHKNGVTITRGDSHNRFAAQNMTKDSVTLYFLTEDENAPLDRMTGIGDGKHVDNSVILGPGENKSLTYDICEHTRGIYVGCKDPASFISCNFYHPGKK